ncbi:MAG: DoxX family protein [Solirubrobacteraceae bacterium]
MLSLLRVILGALFVGHGTQKLYGWFGGHGPEATGQFFESLGLRPGRRNAIASGAAEAGGGAILATGVANPLATAAISGTMFTAIRHVHLSKGVWVSDGGFEYNLVILAALAAITAEEDGPGWALAALAAGAAGSVLVSELGRRESDGQPATGS